MARRGNNPFGLKWNKGGAKSRLNGYGIDFSQFTDFAERLEAVGKNVQEAFTTVMEGIAEDVQADTINATKAAYLPAKGKYSTGQTMSTIEEFPKAMWSGNLGTVAIGFDKSKIGAGGFLITGTPKMQPDYKLEDIYARKKYTKKKMDEISDWFLEEISAAYSGKG